MRRFGRLSPWGNLPVFRVANGCGRKQGEYVESAKNFFLSELAGGAIIYYENLCTEGVLL